MCPDLPRLLCLMEAESVEAGSLAQSSRAGGYPPGPLTPPYVRFRIRRFMKHTGGAAE